MKRRVIKQGHNTLTLTLPKEWADRQHIKPGDEINITVQDRSLVLSKESGSDLLAITIDIAGLTPPLIWRFVSSAYRAGYDEIKVTGLHGGKKNICTAFSYNTLDYLKENDIIKMNPMEVVQAVTNRLIGIEIIEQREEYCIIKELGETNYEEFDRSLRRIFHLLNNEMDIVKSGLEGTKSELRAIHILDTNLDRFEDFCFRVLNKRGYKDFKKTPMVYSTVFMLEMIGDELKKIAMHTLESKLKNTKILVQSLAMNNEQLKKFLDLYYNFDRVKAKEIFEACEKNTLIFSKTNKQITGDDKEIIYHLRKIAVFILSLIELRIDMEV